MNTENSEKQSPEAQKDIQGEAEALLTPIAMEIEPQFRQYLRVLAAKESSSEGVVAANLVRVALMGLVQQTQRDQARKEAASKPRIITSSTQYSKGRSK